MLSRKRVFLKIYFFLIEYNYFTVLCWFAEPHICHKYMYVLFLEPPPHPIPLL